MLKHKHLLVRAEVLEPPKDLKSTRLWLKKLIKDIDMKILGGPYLKYCENINYFSIIFTSSTLGALTTFVK